MRVFLAGAGGVIGQRLIPLLLADGHEVTGMVRSIESGERVARLGAQPAVCDVFDLEALTETVVVAQPEVVLHELTDLPDEARRIAEFAASNNRIRREGTKNLLAAAAVAAVPRLIAQSVAWELPGEAGLAKLDLETQVLVAGGVVLRYGQFYGPGTYHESSPPDSPRIHVEDAARRTLESLDSPSGVYVVAEQ